MRVRITRQHAATYNGAPLPGPGAELDVTPDDYARFLIAIKVAEEAPEPKPEPEPEKAKPAAKKRSTATAKAKETR